MGPYRIEVVWNREFWWVSYGGSFETQEAAATSAKDLADSGDGAMVKKWRVLDSEGNVVKQGV